MHHVHGKSDKFVRKYTYQWLCIFDQIQVVCNSRYLLQLLLPRLPLGHPEKEIVRILKIYILQYVMMILALNKNVGLVQ